jgi:HCNGP-like protein
MNGAATTRHRNVTIEDESEPGDPPPRPYAPSPSPSQSPVPQQLPSPKVRSPRPVSPHAPSPEVIDVDSPSSDSPEYISQLSYQNSLIREATMPILPPDLNDFGIPPSPPGSPDPSLTAKLDKFRQLREQGVFFNDRLGENRGFRNPKLLERLRGFVGVKDEYASHLPIEIWNPHAFTEDQYFDVLGIDDVMGCL